LVVLPFLVSGWQAQAQSRPRQENLVPQAGVSAVYAAEREAALAPVEVAVTGGAGQDPIAVSPDGANWYAAGADGKAALRLAPGSHTLCAAQGNRIVRKEITVPASKEITKTTLDLGAAPQADDLLLYTFPAGEGAGAALPVSGAGAVAAEPLPNGFSVAAGGGGASLAVDPALAQAGFHSIRLTLTNAAGETECRLGVFLDDGAPATEIRTADDLALLREDLSGHFVLADDLDLSAVDGWTPIGTEANPFTGTFDGGGHEIKGFHAPGKIEAGTHFSFFGAMSGAVVENLIFREPMVTPEVPPRASGTSFCCSVLGTASSCLVRDCASIGGIVHPTDGSAAGLVTEYNAILLGLFNSTAVVCEMEKKWLPNTGGVAAAAYQSFLKYCANEGAVSGNHLTGGVASFTRGGFITRCVNSGSIEGRDLVGEYPAGGVCQTIDYGRVTSCAFLRGQSADGAKVFAGPAVLAGMQPVTADGLRDPAALAVLGPFEEAWCYASLDAYGPVPIGVFKQRTPAPQVVGGAVVPPGKDGIEHYYKKENGKTFVCAACRGMRDSEWVEVP
jgi:hypothetical protein